jgi:hypothetical protein
MLKALLKLLELLVGDYLVDTGEITKFALHIPLHEYSTLLRHRLEANALVHNVRDTTVPASASRAQSARQLVPLTTPLYKVYSLS